MKEGSWRYVHVRAASVHSSSDSDTDRRWSVYFTPACNSPGRVHSDDPRIYMKGITEPVYFNSAPLLEWDLTLLPLRSMSCSMGGDEIRHQDTFIPGSVYMGTLYIVVVPFYTFYILIHDSDTSLDSVIVHLYMLYTHFPLRGERDGVWPDHGHLRRHDGVG